VGPGRNQAQSCGSQRAGQTLQICNSKFDFDFPLHEESVLRL